MKSGRGVSLSLNRLSQALIQDRYCNFTLHTEGFGDIGDCLTRGFATSFVTEGGKGKVSVSIVWKINGKIKKFETEIKVMPGQRPRCQVMKLLDPDPTVRYMATTELRFMGLAAKPYLVEQRKKATSKLQKAIDQVICGID
ncbi:MAG: hypothetical protein ACFCD0_20525 [Gemmataceae bacterium]